MKNIGLLVEKTEKKKEENELRRKMIGQWRRVIVVKREKCPEKKISLVNRGVVIESRRR